MKSNIIVMERIDFYISKNDEYKKIIETDINISNESVKFEIGPVKNQFVKKLINMGDGDTIFLKNLKKNEEDEIAENLQINKNFQIEENNYKEYIRRNGVVTTTKGLILRTLDYCDNIEKLKEIWKEKEDKYNGSLIDIPYCGYIYEKKNINVENNSTKEEKEEEVYVPLTCFVLCKKYGDFKDVMKLCLEDSINYLKSYLKFLMIISQGVDKDKKKVSAICTNLRLYNYGVRRDSEGNAHFIMLEINEDSLLFREKIKEKINEKERLNYLVGTSYIPYYVANDHFIYEKDWEKRLDKLYCVGLFELILYLFFRKSSVFFCLYELMTNIIALPKDLQYHTIVSRYNKCRNKQIIMMMIQKLSIKYCDIDGLLGKYLQTIIHGLLDENYENIPYPGKIYENIEKIEKEPNSFEEMTKIGKDIIPKDIGYNDKILNREELRNKIDNITNIKCMYHVI